MAFNENSAAMWIIIKTMLNTVRDFGFYKLVYDKEVQNIINFPSVMLATT